MGKWGGNLLQNKEVISKYLYHGVESLLLSHRFFRPWRGTSLSDALADGFSCLGFIQSTSLLVMHQSWIRSFLHLFTGNHGPLRCLPSDHRCGVGGVYDSLAQSKVVHTSHTMQTGNGEQLCQISQTHLEKQPNKLLNSVSISLNFPTTHIVKMRQPHCFYYWVSNSCLESLNPFLSYCCDILRTKNLGLYVKCCCTSQGSLKEPK